LERQIASTVGRLKTTDATERRSLQQQLGYERSQLQSEQLVHGRLESLQPWVDRYMPSEPFPTLVAIIGFLLLGTLIKVVFLVGNIILAERLSQLVAFQLRKQFFRRTLRMDLASFGDDRTATLIARFTNDMDAVTGGVQVVIGKLLREPLKLAVFFGCAGWICWRLLLLSLIVTPPIMYLVSRLASSIKRANRKAMEEMATMYGHLSESFHSIQVVQAYTMEAGERNRFHQTAKKLYAKSMKIVTYAALTKPATELMGLTVISMAILAGGYLVLNQETHLLGIRMSDRPLDFGSIMAFFGFLIAMTDPARRMTDVMGMLQRATAAADRVFETMDREPTIDDPAEPRSLTTPQFDIVLDRVSFGYHDDRPIL
ncbi:MAG: hypothetical protein KDA55_18315, partial [Planctomycetales bacterium]|nr:hypothetical protein [Planctomycetales bacterium]